MNKVKVCTKCGIEKGLSEFGNHKITKDGLNYRCRSCAKAYSELHRDKIRSYSKIYNKSYKKDYRKTGVHKDSKRRYAQKYPNAYKSRNYYTHNKHKITTPIYCSSCPSTNNIQAHHNDYNKPMDVIYLCAQCHADWHTKNTPLNRIVGIFTENQS